MGASRQGKCSGLCRPGSFASLRASELFRSTSSVQVSKAVSLGAPQWSVSFWQGNLCHKTGFLYQGRRGATIFRSIQSSTVLKKTECAMRSGLSLNRTRRLPARGCQMGKNGRLHLSDTGTKVLFRVLTPPSTFVRHAEAPASLCISAGRLLPLRARDLI